MKNADIANCLKKYLETHTTKQLFDRINDIIFDDPYLKE